jgi:hypothetical protein
VEWIGKDSTWLDILAAAGSFATVITLFFAAWSIRQNAQARNISSLVAVTQQLFAEREKAQAHGIYGMSGQDFHVFQMTNLVEQACFIVNHGLVSGRAKDFLVEWLRNEIASMEEQEPYQVQFAGLTEGELTELMKLRARFHRERAGQKHWDNVIAGRRWSGGIFKRGR